MIRIRCCGARWYQAQLVMAYTLLFLSTSLIFTSLQTTECVYYTNRRLQVSDADPPVAPSFAEQLADAQAGGACNDSAVLAEVREQLKQDLWTKLVHVSHGLGRALRSSRGGATAAGLRASYDALQEVLLYLNSAVRTPDAQRYESHLLARLGRNYVCPETYKGENYGYPFFHEGFVTERCTGAQPLPKVVSIALSFLGGNHGDAATLLRDVEATYPGVPVHVAAPRRLQGGATVRVYTNLTRLSAGDVWNYLVSQVTTPFVFVGRDLTHLTNDSRLERLIRETNSLQVDVAAGALRTPDGRWRIGCQQVALRNYTLRYRAGYELSAHECVYCDDVSAAFVARTAALRAVPFVGNVSEAVLFASLFLDLRAAGRRAVVCPDAMFHAAAAPPPADARAWLPVAQRLQVSRVRLADGSVVALPCPRAPRCEKLKGVAASPCCAQRLSDMVGYVMRACERARVVCELQEGTLLGAVKMGKVLPWDQDADVTFVSANYSALARLRADFKAAGYALSEGGDLWCCVDNRTAGGKFIVTTPAGWHLELYGQHYTDTERLLAAGMAPTKVLLDGQWVGAPANPGLYVRNRYGYEVYKHAQHWMLLGHDSGWQTYQPAQFSRCPRAGHHACLDQFSVDGNMQFEDPLS